MDTGKLLIEKLKVLIDKNLGNPKLSVDEISKELGVSRTQLHRVVKQETQLSTTLFIRKLKLEKAKGLLENTDLRVSEIADQIGIESPQNFSKYFIQEYQVSPTEYRKLNRYQQEQAVEIAVNDAPETPEPEVRPRRPMLLATLLGLVLLVVMVFAALNKWVWGNDDAGALATRARPFANSVAILPFKNTQNDSTLAKGLSEEVHNALSQITDLKVTALASSGRYRHSNRPLPEIGRELVVDYVLLGRVQQRSNQVEISLQLVQTAANLSVWSKKYSGRLGNIFNLVNAMVRDVATELHQSISSSLSQRLDRIPTTNPAAYNELLRGRSLLATREYVKLRESIRLFERAIALDSGFAEAYANKAGAYQLLYNLGYSEKKASLDSAEKNVLAAIRLDPESSMAYAILGNIYRDQYKWEQARTAYQISLQYKPNDALTLYWYSLMLRSIGKPAEALEMSGRARMLDPLYPVIMAGHVLNCCYAGRFDEAERCLKESELIFDGSFLYYFAWGYYHLLQENYKEAVVWLRRSHQINPTMGNLKMLVYYAEAKRGNTAAAEAYLKSLGQEGWDSEAKAMIYSGLGQYEPALAALQDASAKRNIHPDLVLHPAFRIFHKDPRFIKILEEHSLQLPE
jgi:TolB-like protein/AraC-like DNA-binding protein/Tfp pilus assembly protein PilF